MSAWIKLMNALRSNPKTLSIGDPAFRLYISSLLYANEHLTDGRLEHHVLTAIAPTFRRPRAAKDELLNAGLWENGDGCWLIHDYLDVQSASEEIAEKRARTAGRVRRHRARNGVTNTTSTAAVTPPEEEKEEEGRNKPPQPPASGGRRRDKDRFASEMAQWREAAVPTDSERDRWRVSFEATPDHVRSSLAHLHPHASPNGRLLLGCGAGGSTSSWISERFGSALDDAIDGPYELVDCGCPVGGTA